MADNREVHFPVPDLSDPRQRHETRDINVWAIGKVGLGLVFTTIVSIFIVLGVFHYLQEQYQAVPAAGNNGVDVDARQLPPDPRLLTNEPENLQQVRMAEDQISNGYRWSDDKHTRVSVPISRAIDMLIARGLPSSGQANAAGAPADVAVPTESGLGPKMQMPGGPLAAELAAAPPAAVPSNQGAETKGK
jgi:hypothetical protein